MKSPNLEVGKKALITLDNWFIAPDGTNYKAVFGTVHGVYSDQETLGVKTNARSTNWYVTVGALTIAGCQVHYAFRTDDCNMGEANSYSENDKGEINVFTRPSQIYNADQVYPCVGINGAPGNE